MINIKNTIFTLKESEQQAKMKAVKTIEEHINGYSFSAYRQGGMYIVETKIPKKDVTYSNRLKEAVRKLMDTPDLLKTDYGIVCEICVQNSGFSDRDDMINIYVKECDNAGDK